MVFSPVKAGSIGEAEEYENDTFVIEYGVDDSLIGTSKSVQVNGYDRGQIVEEYQYSSYTHRGSTRQASNVGPRQNDQFIVSVAKGQTVSITGSKTITGTIEASAGYSATLNSSVKKAVLRTIATAFSLSFSGSYSVSKTVSVSNTYSGPGESSAYNTRSYYIATNYDSYNSVVRKIDYYNQVNTTTGEIVGQTSYYTDISCYQVKVARPESYSIDG